MSQGVEFDLKQAVLLNATFGPQEVRLITESISKDFSQYRVLREAVQELEVKDDHSPASLVRLGVCKYLLCRYRDAIETLRRGDGGAMAHYYIGKAHFGLQEFDDAVASYRSAAQAGYNAAECTLSSVEALRQHGRPGDALAELDNLSGAVEQTADYLYQRGATVARLGGNPQEVVALFDRAVQADPNHAGALFGLAMETDRRGHDWQAIDLYKRCAMQFPAHVGSLLNLGILYEDTERFDLAAQCYQRILDAYPGHPRASLYLKDARASGNMYYDEEAARKRDRMSQVMNIPVTDFELTVRSRNCLQKMGIMTLGDLCACSEQELLASKNFGETSLNEIREMLASKGLRLGQMTQERRAPEPFEAETLSADEQALYNRPISDLNLSVRARKCMIRLGISTIGDLMRRSGDDLLECKNFGVTSLNEVRDKLTQFDLKLRGD